MNKAERAFQDALRELGCIACIVSRGEPSPSEIHHMLRGGRRMGEMFVLPLCFLHHRAGRDDSEAVSRDHNQRRFEARYGTEAELLAKCRQLVAEQRGLRVG